MKKRPEKGPDNIATRIIVIGTLIAACFWVFDSAVDALVFGGEGFLESLLAPEPVELWMRCVVMGMIVGVSVYARHLIRWRRSVDKERERLLRETEKANQELKDFASIISHDLKAPLRGINQLSQWISEDYSERLDDAGKENLKLLRKSCRHMQEMLEGVLLYSRAGRKSPKLVKVDTDALVRDVIESLSPPPNIRFRVGPGLPAVTMDPVQLGQIFQNLIGNAVKFIDKPEGTVEIGCRSLEDYWEFHVKDNGPGIDGRHFERIFQIFQTLDDRGRRGGTGVGLTIVKKIVEMNGGHVHVESTMDKGSTFSFMLPKS